MFAHLTSLLKNSTRNHARRERHSGFRPNLEMLEDRLTPANTVNAVFSAGTLTITAADDLAVIANNHNDITLTGNGAGTFKITGNGTSITGGTDFTGVTNIIVKMGLGNDYVRFNSTDLAGKLTVQGGDGYNHLILGDTVGNCKFGAVSVTNGVGKDFFTMQKGFCQIVGALTVNNGVGDSDFKFGTDAADQIRIGSVNVVNGAGKDRYDSTGTDFKVFGAMTINNGAGGSFLSFNTTSNLTIGGDLKVTNTDGYDLLALGFGGTASLKNVTISNGHGGSATIFDADTTISGNLNLTNGDGYDLLSLHGNAIDFIVTGAVNVKNGHGGSTTSLDATGFVKIGGALNITNGDGQDDATFGQNSAVELQTVTIKNGNGDSSTNFSSSNNVGNTITGNLSITNGDGKDTFEAAFGNTFKVTGAVTIKNGNGDTTTNLTSLGLTEIGGTLSIVNGAGNDIFLAKSLFVDLHSVSIANGNGDTTTTFNGVWGGTITGNFALTNGDGKDEFNADGQFWNVTGNVTIKHGSGDSTTKIDAGSGTSFQNHIGGKLTVSGKVGYDSIQLERTQVTAATLLSTGDDGDYNSIFINDSEFDAAFSVIGGSGVTNISIEETSDNGFGTAFKGAVTIDAGSNDDFLTIGLDANDFATFYKGVTLKGGLGLDTLKGTGMGNFNQYLGGNPTKTGWEAES